MKNEPVKSKLIPGIGREPFPAYRGDGRYIFISYAHKDAYLVYPEIIRFQEMGYNIWYDEGIAPANEWLNNILDHLENADLIIIFITNNSVASPNVKKEFRYAIDEKKPILPIYLEEFDGIDMDKEWKYELRGIQGILKTALDDEEYVFKFTEAFREFGFEIFNFPKEFTNKNLNEVETNPKTKLNNIKGPIEDFFNKLYLYGNDPYVSIFKSSLDFFIKYPGFYAANEVYSNFISLYEILMPIDGDNAPIDKNTNSIRYLYSTLKNYGENHSKQNFVHCVNVFILGLAIYSQNKTYRTNFEKYLEESRFDDSFMRQRHEEFFIRWGIASLFHDCCFAIETSKKHVKDEFYKDIRQFLNCDEDSIIKGLSEFNIITKITHYTPQDDEHFDVDKPSDILAYKIAHDFNYDMGQLQTNLNFFLNYVHEKNFEEHGFVASILLLNAYSNLIKEYHLASRYFYSSIVDSAEAILLHTYYHHIFQNEPFEFGLLSVKDNPCSYLLILCDELLETSVDSIEFNISDIFEAVYEIKSSSKGFGFFDKEKVLSETICLSDIFDEFTIKKNVSSNTIFEIKKREFKERYIEPPIFLVEKIAYALYEQYDKSELPFDKLPLSTKRSYINESKNICSNLSFLRYDIVDITDPRESITSFSQIELNELAKLAHQQWCDEKTVMGWRYGDPRDEDNRISPFLVSWEKLDDCDQTYDFDFVESIPTLLATQNLKIVRSKLNLFTLNRHKFYCEFTDKDLPFESLPYYIQESNYQQTNRIGKILFGMDYDVVDEDDSRKPIDSFSPEEVEKIAKKLHTEWVKSRLNLGSPFNKNLVEWNRLDEKTRFNSKKTIENLPRLSQNVGLKIVKNN